MRAEGHTLFRQFAQPRQAHNLKAAGIGQNRLIPVHKFVQAAHFFNQISPRTKHQMVSVAEQNLCACCRDGFRHHGFYRAAGANGHKCRRINSAVFGMEFAEAGFAAAF